MIHEIISRVQQDDLDQHSKRLEKERNARELLRAKSGVKVFNTSELMQTLAGTVDEVVLDSSPTEGIPKNVPDTRHTGFPPPPTGT